MSYGSNYLPAALVERGELLRREIKALEIVQGPALRRSARPREVLALERSAGALQRRIRERKRETRRQKVKRSRYDHALYLEKRQARHFAAIRGLLELQRAGVLWLWVDEDEMRVAAVPILALSRRVTMQQATWMVKARRLVGGPDTC